MKKTIAFLFGLLVFISCTTADSNDASGNPTTTVVPVAPTSLIATVSSANQVNLSWTDNSTNETGFKIERKTGTGIFTIVGSTATDITIFNDTGLIPSTTYIYRVYSYNTVGNSPTYSNEVTVTTTAAIFLPALTTAAASTITVNTAVSGGAISSDGGAAITAKGVCWNTSANPTVALTTKTNNGSGTSVFTSNMTGLIANTTYYVRAYATNSVGTAYGNEVSFTTANFSSNSVTDIDGNTYQSIPICTQKWTQRNLNVSKYSDGTPIPQVTTAQLTGLTTGAWCYYNNDPANEAIYGKLYNWYAVAGIYDEASAANPALRKKLAPVGWHIPTNAEMTQLLDCLGEGAALKMKATGTIEAGNGLWVSSTGVNYEGTNESGFTGLPGGYCYSGASTNMFTGGYWWISSPHPNQDYGYQFHLLYVGDGVGFYPFAKFYGLSVRCIKD